MSWLFQGNPKRYDIDDYLARYPQLIYWYTPQFISEIAEGDRAYIWRSGEDGGLIAVGHIAEAPVLQSEVRHPEALGDDLWRAIQRPSDDTRTGIALTETRLTVDEGMVTRAKVKANAELRQSTILRFASKTVYKLSTAETMEFEILWGSPRGATVGDNGVSEGERRLYAHFRRERSASLRAKKLESAHRADGVCCEICGVRSSDDYPPAIHDSIFEVHHRIPLAVAASPVRTTLDDLAILCANCHRAVHSSVEVAENFKELVAHWSKAAERTS